MLTPSNLVMSGLYTVQANGPVQAAADLLLTVGLGFDLSEGPDGKEAVRIAIDQKILIDHRSEANPRGMRTTSEKGRTGYDTSGANQTKCVYYRSTKESGTSRRAPATPALPIPAL